ncbi:hypothetical protein ACIQU6_43970, partial [Streptomyces sp. NPDC090442]
DLPNHGGAPRVLPCVNLIATPNPPELQMEKAPCKKLAGAPKEISQAEQQKMLDKGIKYAQCLRDQGINAPDPQMKDGKIMAPAMGLPDGDKGKMEKATKACNDKLGE